MNYKTEGFISCLAAVLVLLTTMINPWISIALSDALGWGLTRTQTLADGCSLCDFRFIKGSPTRISSKTAYVQEVIERIWDEERNN